MDLGAKSVVGYHIGAFPEGFRKTKKYLNRNKLQGRDLKPGVPEYEAGVPTMSSGIFFLKIYFTENQ